MLNYDYSKLRGRIIEKCGSLSNFAVAMGISKQALSKKMTGKTYWSQDDIVKAFEILDVPLESAGNYFFVEKRKPQ